MADLTVERRGKTAPRRAMGRPSKYNDVLAEAICERLRQGATRTSAAEASGVNRETLREWISTYPAFSANVMQAEAEHENSLAIAVTEVGLGINGYDRDWKAAIEVLKRKYKTNGWGDTLDLRRIDADTLLQLFRMQQGENQTTTLSLEAGDEVL